MGLVLIVFGTGLLKPNSSAIVGDLYPEGGARRDAGFSIFYMGINIGAFFGQIVTGFLGENYGWHFGFGAAGVGMLIGLATFSLMAKRTLGSLGLEITKHPDPVVQARQQRTGKTLLGVGLVVLITVIVLAATGILPLNPQVIGGYMTYVLVGVAVVYFGYLFIAGGLSGDEKKRVGVIAILFVFAAIFWSAFEQAGSTLNLFADRLTDNHFLGYAFPSSWFQSVNSVFLVVLAGVFAAARTGRSRVIVRNRVETKREEYRIKFIGFIRTHPARRKQVEGCVQTPLTQKGNECLPAPFDHVLLHRS